MLKYKIIYGDRKADLEEKVNAHLKEDWNLQGGVTGVYGVNKNNYFLAQAVTKVLDY